MHVCFHEASPWSLAFGEDVDKSKEIWRLYNTTGTPQKYKHMYVRLFWYHWRISTNCTERLFMFSLDKVHLKAYVLTKIIRKELFVPEYRDRLSTFHFKTAFFFAVENTQRDVWREDNLINCVKCILATLKRFLMCRICPHFTIENVNLFDGKIARHEFSKLVDKLTYVIHSLRATIENMQMDNIGKTLKSVVPDNIQHYLVLYLIFVMVIWLLFMDLNV